jgi:hypothetical protein
MGTAVTHLETPVASILGFVRIGEALELGVVGHADGLAFDNEVEALVQGVITRSQDAMSVVDEVLGFALGRTRAEIEGIIEPYRQDRGDVGPAIGGTVDSQ